MISLLIERCLQLSGELVVGESMKHALTSGLTEHGAPPGIIHESVDRSGNSADIAWIIEDESGTAIENSFGRSSAAACERGHTGTCGLEEHDAEPLLFEASPAVPAQHGEKVDSAVEFGQFIVGHPAEETHRARSLFGPTLEATTISTRTGDKHLQLRIGRSENRGGVDERVETLAGNQSTQPENREAARRQPEAIANGGAALIGEWTKPIGVDARRDDHGGQGATGRSLGLGRGISTGCDHDACIAQNAGE